MDAIAWIKQRLLGSQVIALGLVENGDDQWQIHALVLDKQADGEVTIAGKHHFLSFGQLAPWLEERWQLPIVLGLDSQEILTRKVDGEAMDKERLLQSIIPQAKPEEFFIQAIEEKHCSFVSVVRNHLLDQVRESLPPKLVIQQLSLSPIAKMILSKGLEDEHVSLGNMNIIKREGFIENFEMRDPSGDPIQFLSGEGLEKHEIGAYAAGIAYLSEFPMLTDFDQKKQEEELMHLVFFRKFAKYLVAAVFVLFLLNALLFLDFSKKNETLTERNFGIESMKSRIDQYVTDLEEYQDLLKADKNIHTQMADELGASVPRDISFSRLEMKPLLLQSKEKGGQQRMVIEGTALTAMSYTRWIEKLERLSWVGDVIRNEFKVNPRTQEGAFVLELNLREDV